MMRTGIVLVRIDLRKTDFKTAARIETMIRLTDPIMSIWPEPGKLMNLNSAPTQTIDSAMPARTAITILVVVSFSNVPFLLRPAI